jgi:CheY-specific phosphatase CheX
MINFKVNSITGDELYTYAKQFSVSLSKGDAEKIASYLRGKRVDLFNDQSRAQVIKEIAKITSPETAKQINQVFIQFTK